MSLQASLAAFVSDLSSFPSRIERNRVGPVAAAAEVAQLERSLGVSLPASFRDFLLSEAGSLEWDWEFEDGALIRLAGEREPIRGGGLSFSLETILQGNPLPGSDDADDYGRQYRPEPLLAFASTPNGDQFGVLLSGPRVGSVCYLSHDLEEIHMYAAGTSVPSFFQNYGRLGFAGPEHWIWEQFTSHRTTPIDPNSPKGSEFLQALRTGARSREAEAHYARAEAAARLAQFNVMIRPRAQEMLDAKQHEKFVELLDDYADLLAGPLKARYQYLKRKRG